MSTTTNILRTYRSPGTVVREFKTRGVDEFLLITWLVFACILFFIARLPALAREAHFSDGEVPFSALALGTFFGTIFLAPMLFFALAGLSHMIARLFGGRGEFVDGRIALFWALLAISPLVLLQGMVAGLIGQGFELQLTSLIAFVGFLTIWLRGLVALERQ